MLDAFKGSALNTHAFTFEGSTFNTHASVFEDSTHACRGFNTHVAHMFKGSTHMRLCSRAQHTCVRVRGLNTHVFAFEGSTHMRSRSRAQHTCVRVRGLNTCVFVFKDSTHARRGFNAHTHSRVHVFKGSTLTHSCSRLQQMCVEVPYNCLKLYNGRGQYCTVPVGMIKYEQQVEYGTVHARMLLYMVRLTLQLTSLELHSTANKLKLFLDRNAHNTLFHP